MTSSLLTAPGVQENSQTGMVYFSDKSKFYITCQQENIFELMNKMLI